MVWIKGAGVGKKFGCTETQGGVHNGFHTSEEFRREVASERVLPCPFECLRRSLLLSGALLDVLLLSLGGHLLTLLRVQLLLQQNEARLRATASEVLTVLLQHHTLVALGTAVREARLCRTRRLTTRGSSPSFQRCNSFPFWIHHSRCLSTCKQAI